MGRTQKIFTTGLWAIVVIGMIALVASRAGRAREFPPLYDTPAFEFTDQNGKTFAKTDLMGKVWIADFIFTHCGGPCPIMSSKLANVQKQVDRPDVKLVSFSVDPERDTPAVLKEYAKSYGADESRWSFLTGPKQAIYDTAAAMKITAVPATADAPIIHSDLFLLVDRAGQVVGVYHSNDNDKMNQLIVDAIELADRK